MNFGEKKSEYSAKSGMELPVWQTPKYEQSKAKAIEVINKYDDIHEGDFWILMNESRTKKMLYTGLIISHNACLKINEHLDEKDRFRPECVTMDKEGYKDSLVFTYCCPEQGIYEVGEVSPGNCKIAYPYAMAFKRCFDRVVLKMSKIAYDGIYSDSEADEFRENVPDMLPKKPDGEVDLVQQIKELAKLKGVSITEICEMGKAKKLTDMPDSQKQACVTWLKGL